MYHSRIVLSVVGSVWYMIRNLHCTVTIDSVLANSKTQNALLFTVNAIFRHDYPLAVEPGSTPRHLVEKKTWRDSLRIDMLLSAVSVLVVAQSISEIPEGLMNNPVFLAKHSGPWSLWNGSVRLIDNINSSHVPLPRSSVLPDLTGYIVVAKSLGMAAINRRDGRNYRYYSNRMGNLGGFYTDSSRRISKLQLRWVRAQEFGRGKSGLQQHTVILSALEEQMTFIT